MPGVESRDVAAPDEGPSRPTRPPSSRSTAIAGTDSCHVEQIDSAISRQLDVRHVNGGSNIR
jgi:hypothetical protein